VMGRAWQPHESHLPYLLQLKIDFNLSGMGWLRLSAARFRCVHCTASAGGQLQPAGWAMGSASGAAQKKMTPAIACSAPVATCCRSSLPSSRPPLPAAFTRQRRGWATRHLVVETEPGAESLLPPPEACSAPGQPGSGCSPGASASQSMRLWTAGSTPGGWVWGAPGGGGQRGRSRVPRRQSTCQLELDASVDHILNRQQVMGAWGRTRQV